MRIENPYANSFGVHMDISSKIAVLKKALVKNPYLFADLIAESFFQLEAESKAEQDEQRAILDEDELAKQGPPRKPRDLLAAYVYPDPEFNNKMLRYQNSMLHHEQNNLTPEKIEEIKKLNEDLRRHQEREDFPKNVLDYLASRYLKSKVPWSSNIAEYIKTLDAAEIERLRESEIQYPILQGKDAIRFEIMQLEERRAARRAQEEAEAEAAAAAAEAAEAAAAAAAGGGGGKRTRAGDILAKAKPRPKKAMGPKMGLPDPWAMPMETKAVLGVRPFTERVKGHTAFLTFARKGFDPAGFAFAERAPGGADNDQQAAHNTVNQWNKVSKKPKTGKKE
eukprot:comp21353_c0_seq3/m.45978 comp21353_c0_seq3/g.45978  ORF comp21353_c0_seq3/g.45978 comp21353_c0_seq3/m.45978 type:complete len:337 (+) comp21353_c0_seq3:1-1011(+)